MQRCIAATGSDYVCSTRVQARAFSPALFANQSLRWPIYLREPASFRVSVDYQRIGEPGDFLVTCGETVLRGTTRGREADDWVSDYLRHDVGVLELPAGKHLIVLSPAGVSGKGLMRFRGLHLETRQAAIDSETSRTIR